VAAAANAPMLFVQSLLSSDEELRKFAKRFEERGTKRLRGALTELLMNTSRDLGNAKSCCFTLQPITALDFFSLL
jgi:hypothetical protein